jgi:nucleoside-diphosphate-sugar epimerase
MRVALTGGNSAVGRAIVAARWHRLELVAVVRSERAAATVRALDGAARVACVSYEDAPALDTVLQGTAAVIHLAGVLLERAGATYESANVGTARRVAEAATRAGVGKIVLVSAVGADPRSANRYWRTKGVAESLVRDCGVPSTVLRVPMLLGPGTEAAGALRRRLRSGLTWLLEAGRTLQQPLDVDDLARAAVGACEPRVAGDATLDLVGPVAVPAREIVARAARLRGRRIRIVPVPARPVRLALRLLRAIGRPAFSADVLDVLTTDTRLDPTTAARVLGIALTPLDRMIERSLEP